MWSYVEDFYFWACVKVESVWERVFKYKNVPKKLLSNSKLYQDNTFSSRKEKVFKKMRSKDKSSENSLLSRNNFGGCASFVVARHSRNLGVKPYYKALRLALNLYIDYTVAHTCKDSMCNCVIFVWH